MRTKLSISQIMASLWPLSQAPGEPGKKRKHAVKVLTDQPCYQNKISARGREKDFTETSFALSISLFSELVSSTMSRGKFCIHCYISTRQNISAVGKFVRLFAAKESYATNQFSWLIFSHHFSPHNFFDKGRK